MRTFLAIIALSLPSKAFAVTVFRGGGTIIPPAGAFSGLSGLSVGQIIVRITGTILNFAAIVAIAAIVIAGFMLIFDWGNDQMKDRAKKTVIFTVIGLLVLMFVRAMVQFVLSFG